MPNFVQEYRSTDLTSWPSLTGQAGSVIALLDAILVNGGTTISITSISRSGTTATMIIAANTTLLTGQYLTISGWNETDYNGTFQITVNSSTSISFQVANSPTSPGTGTGLYRKAALGWTKAFTGTNLAAFKAASVSGCPQFYLRIDETGGTAGGQKEVAVRAYETMSDVNTGTGPFPTVAQAANGLCWRKSATADATTRTWTLYGDGATFYLVMNSDASATVGRGLYGFGAFTSNKTSDAYNAMISGWSTFNATNASTTANGLGYAQIQAAGAYSAHTGIYCARSFSQAGGSIAMAVANRWASASGALGGVAGLLTYPHGPDGSLWMDAPILFETTGLAFRGRPRGLYTHCHSTIPFASEYDTATVIAGLSGVTLTHIQHNTQTVAGYAEFDTYGPW